MKKKIRFVIGLSFILIGIGIYLYPNIRSRELNRRTSELIARFNEMYSKEENAFDAAAGNIDSNKISTADYETENGVKTELNFQSLYNEMLEYNQNLAENGQQLVDAWSYTQEPIDLTELSNEDGAIGYIEIPAMDVILPLYIGATTDNMAKGAAVMSETSMPIGGTDTNCVIAGHRGYSGMSYFREIEKLEIGDRVFITNIWETLIYEVAEIRVIDPDDIESILIVPGKDMVTLLTCHPYMSHGKYRYVVYCERVEEDFAEKDSADVLNTDSGIEKSKKSGTILASLFRNGDESSEMVILLEKALRILIPVFLILIFVFKQIKKKSRKQSTFLHRKTVL
ncbi:MAG: class C sortase [Lachnospiraceae bacterium]|nr:class C sortase [Lachnospiraceae bacterium]